MSRADRRGLNLFVARVYQYFENSYFNVCVFFIKKYEMKKSKKQNVYQQLGIKGIIPKSRKQVKKTPKDVDKTEL